MTRLLALWIVLTLAAGPNAGLLCGTWCDQTSAGPSRCHREDPTTAQSVAADGGCAQGPNAAVFLGEDERRDVAPRGAHQAVPVPRYQLARGTASACFGVEPGRQQPLDHRPLALALRI